MTSPQKAKGNGFEREVAKFLSEKFGESFIRVPNSGAHIGGKNQVRKQYLHEGQIRNSKGDIIPGQSFPLLNLECKFYKSFPFHQVLNGACKQLDIWLDQLMQVSDLLDINVLCVKINRQGSFVAVQSKLTWISDNFIYYTSANHGDWVLIEFNHFFEKNAEIFKAYCKEVNNNTKTN